MLHLYKNDVSFSCKTGSSLVQAVHFLLAVLCSQPAGLRSRLQGFCLDPSNWSMTSSVDDVPKIHVAKRDSLFRCHTPASPGDLSGIISEPRGTWEEPSPSDVPFLMLGHILLFGSSVQRGRLMLALLERRGSMHPPSPGQFLLS